MTENNKYKFIAAVCVLAALPFGLLARHFVAGGRELRKADALRLYEMRTGAGARIIAGEMSGRYNLARLAADPAFASAGASGRKAALAARLKELPNIGYELALLSSDGKVVARVAAAKDGKPPVDYAGSRVLEGARVSGTQSGAVEYGEYTPPALLLAAPVGPGGKGGFVAGRLSLAYICEVVRALGRNSYGTLGLMDAGGQLIADSANASTMKPGVSAPGEAVTLAAAAMERGAQNMSREVFSRGGSSLVSVSGVPGTAWWLYEIADPAAAGRLGPAERLMLFSCSMLVVLSGFIAFSLARYWLLPPRKDLL